MRVTEAPPTGPSQSPEAGTPTPAAGGRAPAGGTSAPAAGAPMSADAVRAYLAEVFPQVFAAHALVVAQAADGYARLVLTPDERHLRPGGIISGPTLMMLADAAAYAALLSGTDAAKMAVTTNLNITFLRAAPAGTDIVQDARVVKWGRRLSVLVCETSAAGRPVAHTTMSYAMPTD